MLTAIGRATLVSREALKTRAYKDSVGVWTIGIGHAFGDPVVTPGMVITEAEALEIFARDLRKYEDAVDRSVKVPLADHERDALVSICFNIGIGIANPKKGQKPGFLGSSFLKRLNEGDRAGCAKAIMSWVKPPEVTSRRTAERDQFLTSYDVALPKARSTDRSPVKVGAAPKPASAVKKPPARAAAPAAAALPTAPTVEAPAVPVPQPWWQRLLRVKPPAPAAQRPGLAQNGDPALWDVQDALFRLQYPVGLRDGLMGRNTRAAVTAARERNGLPPGDAIDAAFRAALPGMLPAAVSEQRATAGRQELRQQAPEATRQLDGIGLIGKLIMGASGVGAADASGLLDTVKGAADQATETMQSVQAVVNGIVGVVQWCVTHWWLLGLLAGAYVVVRVGLAGLKLLVLLRQGRLL